MFSQYDALRPTTFHDKAWRRADMAAWDLRWQRLTAPARKSILETVRTGPYHGGPRPVNANASLAVPIRAELLRHGFIEAHPEGFLATEVSVGFVHRVRTLRRYALLNPREASQFERYVGQVFATFDLTNVIADIVEKQTGVGRYRLAGDMYETFVRRNFWPEWVANSLADPVAGPMIAAIEGAGGPVPLAWLAESLKGHSADEVRSTYDRLVNHLVLFEDLDGASWEILTGLLPEVRTEQRKGRLKKPAKLEPIAPAEEGPEGGVEIPDLRAALLEASASSPRVKQDGSLFAKERDRFVAALDPLPAWMVGSGQGERLEWVLWMARRLEFVRTTKGADDAAVLELTPQGQRWLALGREGQYAAIFRDLREGDPPKLHPDSYEDRGFLGASVRASLTGEPPRRWRPDHCRPLRDSLHALFLQLPLGSFFSVDQFLTWAGEPAHNPLLLGRPKRDVTVYLDGRVVPPLDDHLAEACRSLLRALLNTRLVGLGCVRLGRGAGGQVLFARLPRLDAYFGLEVEPAAPVESRVIVQPDFSVVVIGMDPGPLAELTPFCERVRGSSESGALTFRISRESVFRGIGGGLAPDAIVERLTRLSSHALPQNVLSEVKGWCAQARTVSVAPVTLIRCPDAATAQRVAGVLGKQAELVGETAVALTGSLTAAVRLKLQAQGVLVEAKKAKKK